MKRTLTLAAFAAFVTLSQAGNPTSDHRDYELQPGDFGKPVVIAPLPGMAGDPWLIDDPDIIIDDDGPSDEDEGIIYDGSYVLPMRPRVQVKVLNL